MVGRSGLGRVFVAAGHGGPDLESVADGHVEHDMNAAVAALLVARLRAHGIDVVTDLELGYPTFSDEVRLAHEVDGISYDLAVRDDGSDQPAVRAETFGRPGASAELAAALHDAEADAAVVRHPEHVALLAEALCRAVVDHGRVDGFWDATFRPGGPALPPVVSVVVPTRDRPRMLGEAVGSVLAQHVTGIEVIVVDDGSADPVAGFDDPRVRVVRLDESRGPGAARNAGMDAASGRFIAFLDDDDLWTADRLDLALAGLRRAPVAVCWTRHLDRPQGTHRVLDGVVGDALLDGTTPCLGATALRRDLAARFDERWHAIEDLVWWWDLARRAPVATVPSVGYLVRLHAGPRGHNTLDARVRENLELLRERAVFFASHPDAAAHRWLRVGVMATDAGDHANAVRAFARHLRLRPRGGAAAHLALATGRLALATGAGAVRRRR